MIVLMVVISVPMTMLVDDAVEVLVRVAVVARLHVFSRLLHNDAGLIALRFESGQPFRESWKHRYFFGAITVAAAASVSC